MSLPRRYAALAHRERPLARVLPRHHHPIHTLGEALIQKQRRTLVLIDILHNAIREVPSWDDPLDEVRMIRIVSFLTYRAERALAVSMAQGRQLARVPEVPLYQLILRQLP
jgi:hypothetical protein